MLGEWDTPRQRWQRLHGGGAPSVHGRSCQERRTERNLLNAHLSARKSRKLSKLVEVTSCRSALSTVTLIPGHHTY